MLLTLAQAHLPQAHYKPATSLLLQAQKPTRSTRSFSFDFDKLILDLVPSTCYTTPSIYPNHPHHLTYEQSLPRSNLLHIESVCEHQALTTLLPHHSSIASHLPRYSFCHSHTCSLQIICTKHCTSGACCACIVGGLLPYLRPRRLWAAKQLGQEDLPFRETRACRRILEEAVVEVQWRGWNLAKFSRNMASDTFRNSINSLGWSRREADLPASTNSTTPNILSKLSSLNPFGRGGYVHLPMHEPPGAPLPAPSRREEEEGWFAREWSFLPGRFWLGSGLIQDQHGCLSTYY